MPSNPIFTVGHSNRTLSEFTDILRAAEIQALVDVRRFPASRRHPHFNLAPLRAHLASIGIAYHHFPELGGYRSPSDARSASPNDGWPSGFLRSYADYALTEAFQSALLRLRQSAQTATALLCAEKSWKDCHRQIIADYLIANGHRVVHLVDSVIREAPGWPGMLADKPIRVLIATRDVHEPESEDDQVTPVIRRAFSFMGIRDVASLLAGGSLGVNRGEVRLEDHVARFEQAIAALVV